MLALPRSPFPKSPHSLGAVGREVEEGCCGTHGRCVRGESPSPVPTCSTDPSSRSSPASCPKNLPECPLPRVQVRPQHQDQLLLQKALSLWKKGLFFPSHFLPAAPGPEHFAFITNGSVPLHGFSHPLLPGEGWGRTHTAPHGTRGAPQAPQAASSIRPKEKGLRLLPPASEGSLLGSFPP